jgi:hypothetical protein
VLYEPDLAHASFLLNAEVKQALREEVKAVLARSGNAVAGLAMQLSRYVKPQQPRGPAGAPAGGRAAPMWRSWSVGTPTTAGSIGGSSSRSGSRAGSSGLQPQQRQRQQQQQQQQQGPDGEDDLITRRWSSIDARHQQGPAAMAAMARLRSSKQVQQESGVGKAAGGAGAGGGRRPGDGEGGDQAGALKKAA